MNKKIRFCFAYLFLTVMLISIFIPFVTVKGSQIFRYLGVSENILTESISKYSDSVLSELDCNYTEVSYITDCVNLLRGIDKISALQKYEKFFLILGILLCINMIITILLFGFQYFLRNRPLMVFYIAIAGLISYLFAMLIGVRAITELLNYCLMEVNEFTSMWGKQVNVSFYQVMKRSFQFLGVGFYLYVVAVFGLIITKIIDLILMHKETNNKNKDLNNSFNNPDSSKGLLGKTGIYMNAEIPITESSSILIGRDETVSNLIVKGSKVSRKHCWISYLGNNTYQIIDYSSNGTYCLPNRRLAYDKVELLHSGDVIMIGDNSNEFQLL